MHGNQLSIMRSEQWCVTAYEAFRQIAEDGYTLDFSISDTAKNLPTGAHMRPVDFYFGAPIESDRVERLNRDKLRELQEIQKKIYGFRPLTTAELTEANTRFPDDPTRKGPAVEAGYRMTAPVIDTPVYTKWLRAKVIDAGVKIIDPLTHDVSTEDDLVFVDKETGKKYPRRITDRLAPQEEYLRRTFGVQAIVNCAGMGAAELAGASMVPLRGALVRVPRWKFTDGKGPQQAYAMAKSKTKQDMVFIVPREDYVMLGGIAEPGEFDTHPENAKKYPPVVAMFNRCKTFLKGQLTATLDDPELTVTWGVRPYRADNVCLERQYGFNIVHNYGHSGSGYSFSFGCAEEAVDLVQSMEDAAFHVIYEESKL
jgi:D-amino-acid oxidase